MRVPDHLWNQMLLRHDNQITVQEMLAVVLLMGTFRDVLRGALLLLFIDSDGVRHALQRGTGGPPEVALLVGKFWLEAAELHLGAYTARVESKANIADGPTREDVSVLLSLHATQHRAVWPEWAQSLWAMPNC